VGKNPDIVEQRGRSHCQHEGRVASLAVLRGREESCEDIVTMVPACKTDTFWKRIEQVDSMQLWPSLFGLESCAALFQRVLLQAEATAASDP
jgi:hypothetical protein